MAVYTEVSDDALRAFLELYDIGEVTSFKGIAEGVENSNYLLRTTGGQHILTLYEKRVKVEDLPFFIGLMEHLASAWRHLSSTGSQSRGVRARRTRGTSSDDCHIS